MGKWALGMLLALTTMGMSDGSSAKAEQGNPVRIASNRDGFASYRGGCDQQELIWSRYKGVNYWTCEYQIGGWGRYICDDHGNKVVQDCSLDCNSGGVGADDECAGGGGPKCTPSEIKNQTGAGALEPSIWTCQGNARYVCDGQGYKVTNPCENICVSSGPNHDDQCE
jgi:hypothetical protein